MERGWGISAVIVAGAPGRVDGCAGAPALSDCASGGPASDPRASHKASVNREDLRYIFKPPRVLGLRPPSPDTEPRADKRLRHQRRPPSWWSSGEPPRHNDFQWREGGA